jgi:YD repeat-containing protein
MLWLNRLTQKTCPDSTTMEYVYDLVGKIRRDHFRGSLGQQCEKFSMKNGQSSITKASVTPREHAVPAGERKLKLALIQRKRVVNSKDGKKFDLLNDAHHFGRQLRGTQTTRRKPFRQLT